MLPLWVNVLIFLGTILGMEGMAWLTHKYVMHGVMWSWHKSHHTPYEGVFEKNDRFGLLFGIPPTICLMIGLEYESWRFLAWMGAGVTAYGILYVLFHDILVHQRVKTGFRASNRYLKRIIRAHKVHHKCSEKDGAEAFGFLYAPKKYEVKSVKPRRE